jgi:UDP-glucose 4-epimerase
VNIAGKKFVVIGGGGLIGSHTVEALAREDVGEVLIYDNFVRGSRDNLREALKDPRVKVYDVGGDILQSDILALLMRPGMGSDTGFGRASQYTSREDRHLRVD